VNRAVLVIDDDPEFRRLASRLLAASGLSVAGEAGSVAQALAAATRLEPSAALVDVELPDGDGLALAREIAALSWRPRVVLTSVDREITNGEEVRRTGAVAFVAKADLPGAPLARLLGGESPPEPD
jgi:two-component system nitrate/nitrite response regulator NarL